MTVRSIETRGRVFTTLILAGALVMSGCSAAPQTEAQGGEPSSGQFTYWSMFKEGEPAQLALAEIVDEFEKDTGITVDIQWVGRDVLTKLQPTLSTTPAADLIDRPLRVVESIMVASGTAADLSPVLDLTIPDSDETVRDVIPATYLKAGQTKDGSQVVIPWAMTGYDLWFNGAKFPELTGESVENWDDFLDVLDESRSLGAPLALDGDILGYTSLWYNQFVLHRLGPGALNAAAGDKTGKTWDEEGYLEAAQRIQDLVDGDYFVDGYNASKFPAIQQKWAADEANFILNGSWLPSEAKPNAADGFEFVSMAFPDDGAGEDYATASAYGWVMPNKSTNTEAVQQFIAYTYQKKHAQAFADATSSISARLDVTESEAVQRSAQTLENAADIVSDDDGIAQSYGGDWSAKVYQPLVTKLITGGTSAEGFIEEIKQQTIAYWELNQ